jgi:putative GTP pyrophosphokinase
VTSISKTQVDQLGDRLRKGNISDDDLRLLDAYRESFVEAYEGVVAAIRSATGLEPAGRWKTNISILAKLVREVTMRLSRMQDIAGCRVVVHDILEQDSVVERLIGAFPAARVDDRRRTPSHGYRAVHVIATTREKLVEIQVRTELQHLWAQQSEIMSDTSDPSIKYGGGDLASRRLLSVNSEWIAGIEKAEKEIADRKTGLVKAFKNMNEVLAAQPRRVN